MFKHFSVFALLRAIVPVLAAAMVVGCGSTESDGSADTTDSGGQDGGLIDSGDPMEGGGPSDSAQFDSTEGGESVGLAAADFDCATLPYYGNYAANANMTSSPREVCYGVSAALAGVDCATLPYYGNYAANDNMASSPREVCMGVTAALNGSECSALPFYGNYAANDNMKSSPREVCMGTDPFVKK